MAGPYDNTAILSKNDRKQTDTHPDVKGTADVCCSKCHQTTSYWLDGWRQERKDGSGSFYKIKLKPKDGAPVFPDNPSEKPYQYQHPLAPGPKSNGPAEKPLDDEIPF